jgi:hypothetical protein
VLVVRLVERSSGAQPREREVERDRRRGHNLKLLGAGEVVAHEGVELGL